jgi:hypothetical protein
MIYRFPSAMIEILPLLTILAFLILVIVVTAIATRVRTERHIIKHHLDDIAKTEIAERDYTIKRLEEENGVLKKENKNMSVKLKALKEIIDQKTSL